MRIQGRSFRAFLTLLERKRGQATFSHPSSIVLLGLPPWSKWVKAHGAKRRPQGGKVLSLRLNSFLTSKRTNAAS